MPSPRIRLTLALMSELELKPSIMPPARKRKNKNKNNI